MICTSMSRWLLPCVCLLAVCAAPAMAQDQSWKVEGNLQGEPKDTSGFEISEDVSGIACDERAAMPRLCLVADDETQGAQIVIRHEGRLVVGDYIRLSTSQHDGDPLELDAEAVAFEDGHFYVTGSHGRPRHHDNPKKDEESNAKAAATRQIFRITLPASAVDMTTGKLGTAARITPSSLTNILQSQGELASSYDQALEDGGLTIEGLAVRDRRLYVGMRGPVIGTDAVVLSVAASAVFDDAPAQPTLHKLSLQTDAAGQARGVRDIVRFGEGFLVLAGPVQDPPKKTGIRPGDYSIYLWDGKESVTRRTDLPVIKKKTKPEALLPLDSDADRVRVLVMFDGPNNGEPQQFEVKLR